MTASRIVKRHAAHTMLATALLAIVGGAASNLAAHDFWIEPSAYRPKIGALVGLRLLVGQSLVGDPVPREPAAIERFVLVNGSGQQPVPGRDGGEPAGIIRVDSTGLLIAGYHSYPRPIELTADKFEQYLGEEGLDAVKNVWQSRKSGSSARELFSRCAKTLLSSGPPSADGRDRALGLPLELVAERNPYLIHVQQDLPFALSYEGKPQPGALVIALSRKDPSKKLTGRTDRQGRVVFRFPVDGAWLVKSVHMIAAKAGANVDWESFWASSTFELAPSDAASQAAR